MAITKSDLDDLQIDKDRISTMIKSELGGTTTDVRNKLTAQKWANVSRSLSQTWVDVTRS